MNIKVMEEEFSVCKVEDYSLINKENMFFAGKTDEENSLVCPTDYVPANTTERSDGWKAFRIQGILDFSLIGILAEITNILASKNIAVFVVSTYNTDYVLVKKEKFAFALNTLINNGYKPE